MDYLWLVLLWIIYFTLHSVMASTQIKKYIFSLGLKDQYYRMIYNIFAFLSLIPVIIISSTINSEFVFYPNSFTKITGMILAGWGVVIARMALKSYDLKAFLGLGNLSPENDFKTDGLLKSVRHPLYTGSILLIIGYFIYNPKFSSLISSCMLIIYFLIGIQFEEKKLIKTFGKKYINYKMKTPMLIPRFWKKK